MVRDNAAFVGSGKRRSYFEGWYFKLVNPGGATLSFIPGMAIDRDGMGEAFVQVILDGETSYVRFDVDRFSADTRLLDVTVGDSRFRRDGLIVSLPGTLGGVSGSVTFRGGRSLSVGPFHPGIMGWYRRVPFMECYHEVVSVRHELSGIVTVGNRTIDFTGGAGYIEKDWGSSMPRSWMWMQCNTFPGSDASLMISIARIPWLGRAFTGFLGFFSQGDLQLQFGTYSRARVVTVEERSGGIACTIDTGAARLSCDARHAGTGDLKAPVSGTMARGIKESVAATLSVTVTDRSGTTLFSGEGRSGGLEIVGSVAELAAKLAQRRCK